MSFIWTYKMSEETKNSVYVFDNLYNNVSNDCLAGMFFAGLFDNSSDNPIISILLPDSSIQIAHRVLPKHKSVSIEIPYVDCFPYNPSKLELKLGSLAASAIGICEYTVVGTRYDSEGHAFSTMVCGFDGFEIIQGFVAYIQSSGSYPAEMIIFRREKGVDGNIKSSIVAIDMDIDFTDVKSNRYTNRWVAPSRISIKYQDQMVTFTSAIDKGWLSDDLKDAVTKKFGVTPDKIVHKIVDNIAFYEIL